VWGIYLARWPRWPAWLVVGLRAGIGQAGWWRPVLGYACAARSVFGQTRVAEGVETGVPTVQSRPRAQVLDSGRDV
jgi:hypothetical protein